MNETVTIKWAKGAKEKLNHDIPDEFVYDLARAMLDMVMPTIPEKTGKTRRSTLSGGVRGGNKEYHIGSYTTYAIYPYTMDNNKTHWTTPGTNSYWFREYWQKHGKSIANMVIKENKYD